MAVADACRKMGISEQTSYRCDLLGFFTPIVARTQLGLGFGLGPA